MNEWIHADERLEDLQRGGLRVLQKREGVRFGMDTVLLSDFARIGPAARVADFGTGTGVLPLLLYGRGKGKRFDAFEIQEEMADMAGRTMKLNGLEEVIRVHTQPVESAEEVLGAHAVDAVVMNPPYYEKNARSSASVDRRLARQQTGQGLAGWLHAAYRVLYARGRVAMVYPASRMLEAMDALCAARLTPKRFRMVYPRADKAAELVLIEAVRDAKPLLHPEPPLIVCAMDGSMTEEMRRIYHLEAMDSASQS